MCQWWEELRQREEEKGDWEEEGVRVG